uniref:Lipase domain-containing protein n=1 Tax=Timema poppense TaxID=170557 RepID=A0A7R9DLW0_TIMPO|nr:unnamed protein product [Timema poppensis]
MVGGRVKGVAWLHNRPNDDWFLLPDDNNGTLHWVDPHDTSPMPMVAESDVTFLLYTRQNPSNPTTIQTGVASSLGNFNANRQTKFVIHGWNSNGNSMATVRNGYVNSGLDVNIIVVDWQRPANQGYAQSMTNTRGVGVFVANHINWLVSRGLNLNNINIVGFSLGAHVAGIAGHNVHGTVGRITGEHDSDYRGYRSGLCYNMCFVQSRWTNGNVYLYERSRTIVILPTKACWCDEALYNSITRTCREENWTTNYAEGRVVSTGLSECTINDGVRMEFQKMSVKQKQTNAVVTRNKKQSAHAKENNSVGVSVGEPDVAVSEGIPNGDGVCVVSEMTPKEDNWTSDNDLKSELPEIWTAAVRD